MLNLFLLDNNDGEGSSKKSLNRMLKDVLPCITNAGVGSADVLFAIQVLRALAPTIHAYLGERASVKIEDKLRSYGEAMMTMDARDTAKSWSLFSQFVKCASAFILEVRYPYLHCTFCSTLTRRCNAALLVQVHKTTLDDSYMRFLGDMLCHVMEAYPFCSWDTRWTIYKSFLALFDAVAKSTVVDTLIDQVVQHTLLLSLSRLSGPNTQVLSSMIHIARDLKVPYLIILAWCVCQGCSLPPRDREPCDRTRILVRGFLGRTAWQARARYLRVREERQERSVSRMVRSTPQIAGLVGEEHARHRPILGSVVLVRDPNECKQQRLRRFQSESSAHT